MKIGFIQAKGGQGTTVVAAMTALALAETGSTLLIGNADVFAVLGTTDWSDGWGQVTDSLDACTHSAFNAAGAAVYDHIVLDGEASEDRTYLVTRPCYLALSAAVRSELTYDGVVLITEPGRALTDRDVSSCLGKPVVAELAWDPAIARAVDAGLLSSRLPLMGRRAIQPLIRERV